MGVKPNLVVVDIDGTVNAMRSMEFPERSSGWTSDLASTPGRTHIHRELIERLADLDRREDTEVVWLSWWPRDLIERINAQLDLEFRILPLGNTCGCGKVRSLRIELLRANRQRVVWLDDDEATADASLTPLADLLALQPDFFVGLTPLYIETVGAYLDGSDEAELIDDLVSAEAWRWNDRTRSMHSYSRREEPHFDNRGTLMREAFLAELASVVQRGHVRPNADESYGKRDGVHLEPWQLEHAVRLWAEHGLRIELVPLTGRPGEILLHVPEPEGIEDDD
ncbi:HAD domain-containing protein [Microbacterium sp. NPDC008134]|uniref:HAD domain-containing protein n=1 Tax=Microbacterium sp. NPDC008134 TaxID=3364183 RepID=UPI0036E8EDB5